MSETRIRKAKIKRILMPDELKQRVQLSLMATGLSLVAPLFMENISFASLVFGIGSMLYHRNVKKKLEETRIGYPKNGQKVYFRLGVDELGRPVEITDYYFHRHMMVVGGTGMGKTSLYRVILRQVLKKRFGVIYINFKAEDEDFFNLYGIAKEVGMAEDLIMLNFAPSAIETGETATYSPLATLETPQEIADFFFNLLAPASGDMEYWQGRGRNLMNAAARTYIYMRDYEKKPASLRLLLDAFEVVNMMRVMKAEDCPENFKAWIDIYLQDLDPSGKLRSTGDMRAFTPEMQNQHGYAMQQWKEALMDISLRYSHIFNTSKPDLDFKEALRNSRLVYIHMPALALPNKTKESLGRLILAGLKTATGAMLGERLFGDTEELGQLKKKEKPKNPFLILIDEHGTAPITGLDDFIRQIRSLGGGAIIADQNWDGIKQKFGDAYLNTLLGNSLTKIVMNVEGSEAVIKYLNERIPKVRTFIPDYKKSEVFIEQTERLNLQEEPIVRVDEIVKLGAGEGYVIQQENIVKCKFDFYKPKIPKIIDLFIYTRDKVSYANKIKKLIKEIEKKGKSLKGKLDSAGGNSSQTNEDSIYSHKKYKDLANDIKNSIMIIKDLEPAEKRHESRKLIERFKNLYDSLTEEDKQKYKDEVESMAMQIYEFVDSVAAKNAKPSDAIRELLRLYKVIENLRGNKA